MTTVIEQLEALAEKASDRPWKSVSGYGAIVTDGASGYHMSEEDRAAYGGGLIGESMPAADRDFIVAVVNAVPDLLALARAAVEEHGASVSEMEEHAEHGCAMCAALLPWFREVQA